MKFKDFFGRWLSIFVILFVLVPIVASVFIESDFVEIPLIGFMLFNQFISNLTGLPGSGFLVLFVVGLVSLVLAMYTHKNSQIAHARIWTHVLMVLSVVCLGLLLSALLAILLLMTAF